jgi:metal-responsive CopG/Arc/MetJ family transcriptional regulator
MKNNAILIRLSDEEMKEINDLFKKEIFENDLISRSELVRRLIKSGIEEHKRLLKDENKA